MVGNLLGFLPVVIRSLEDERAREDERIVVDHSRVRVR